MSRQSSSRLPRPARGPVAALVAATVTTALALAGCGAGDSPSGAQLLVTQDFGARPVADLAQPKVGASATVLSLLEGNLKVAAAGGRVRSVNGIAAGAGAGWYPFVNGVGAKKGLLTQDVRGSDRVWWDHHPFAATTRIQAVVGSFPAPFVAGVKDGKKLPVRVECQPSDIPACQTVQDAMTAAGVFAAKGGLQQSFTKETLRLVVGPYVQIRDDETVGTLEDGPRVSGVFARPAADGKSIAILDAAGRTTRTLGPGDGLIAATRLDAGQPVWIVTGVDLAGVKAAASALDEGNLRGHFAFAVVDGRAVGVPEVRATP